ncbi:hypothetical protein [Streptomyces sp. NPDC053560]|uniref:hypothetical protein n=1 Tax=Streptomyces sp. NPDC053560 TaxID=3365711 RepID=UPI0037D3C34E
MAVSAIAVCAVALGPASAHASAATGTAAGATTSTGTAYGSAYDTASGPAARATTPWKLQLPLGETVSREFWDVASTGAKDVWAVGRTTDGAEGPAPAIKHWNGKKWTDVAAATESKPAQWEKVSASAPDDAWVVGSSYGDASAPLVLQHWDAMATRWTGSGWQSLDALPVDEVNAADVDGAGRLWIAGWSGGNPHSVLSRWTATEWTTETLPADVTEHSEMSTGLGIRGVPGTKGVFAVGTAGCQSDPVMCGVLVSRDLR